MNVIDIYKILIGGMGDDPPKRLKRNLSYRKAVKLIGAPQTCALCGLSFPEELKKPMTSTHLEPNQPTIDHIVPRSKGGTDDFFNLQWTHHKCNQAKGNE